MKILKILFVGLILLFAVTVAINYVLPKDFHFEAKRTVPATTGEIHAVVSDLNTWPEWSAWNREKDPEAKHTFTGTPGTVGHTWAWESEGELGQGTLSLTEVDPAKGIKWHLAFVAPFEGEMDGGIDYLAQGAGTELTWWDEGEAFFPVVGRIIGKLMKNAVVEEYGRALSGLETFLASKKAG